MLTYFENRKSFNLFYLLTCVVLRQKSGESMGVGLDGFSYCNNLTKQKIISDKNLSFSVGFFSPNVASLFMFLKSNSLLQLLFDFPKSSFMSFNLLCTNVYIYTLVYIVYIYIYTYIYIY